MVITDKNEIYRPTVRHYRTAVLTSRKWSKMEGNFRSNFRIHSFSFHLHVLSMMPSPIKLVTIRFHHYQKYKCIIRITIRIFRCHHDQYYQCSSPRPREEETPRQRCHAITSARLRFRFGHYAENL